MRTELSAASLAFVGLLLDSLSNSMLIQGMAVLGKRLSEFEACCMHHYLEILEHTAATLRGVLGHHCHCHGHRDRLCHRSVQAEGVTGGAWGGLATLVLPFAL